MLFKTIALLFVSSCIRAAVIPRSHDINDNAHENDVHDQSPPPAVWHQPLDHPVYSLFRRDIDPGTSYVPVGSAEWLAAYPPEEGTPNTSLTPPEWTAALNAAVAAGTIPNIPQTTLNPDDSISYPAGWDPTSPQVCSGDVGCQIPGDMWNGPDGVYSSSFDDGPWQQTTELVQFLQSQGLTSTHFMIGVNILQYPQQFLQAFTAGHDIACHTWSHPYMTTLSNEQVLAELGWSMQLIHNSTGGRVPRYWRPPYGDSDMRVRAIAKEVFGLISVVWNQDSEDWTYGAADQVTSSVEHIVSTAPKSPGLIALEHEITDADVQGFIAAFPSIAQNGWTFVSLARILDDQGTYQNANSSTSPVTEKDILLEPTTTSSSTTSTAASTSSSSKSTSSQRTSSSSSLLLSHESPHFRLFLSSIILSTVVFLTF